MIDVIIHSAVDLHTQFVKYFRPPYFVKAQAKCLLNIFQYDPVQFHHAPNNF